MTSPGVQVGHRDFYYAKTFACFYRAADRMKFYTPKLGTRQRIKAKGVFSGTSLVMAT